MKKWLLILAVTLAANAAQAQVKFETAATDNVREMAIKQGKLVFIDLYASWCPPCRMMSRHVFSRKDVGKFMDERFVAAKYDTDKEPGKTLLARYGEGAIPLYLYSTPTANYWAACKVRRRPKNSWPESGRY